MTEVVDHSTGWVCTDCLFYLANGDTPSGLSEEEAAAWAAEFDRRNPPMTVSLGLLHSEHGCLDEQNLAAEECDCEHTEFSRRSCDGCGSTLAGARDAVTFWIYQ